MFIKVFAACVVLVSGLLEGACSVCSTQWFNLDDPSDDGDYELLSDLLDKYPELICPDPIEIEVQTVSGQPASQTGNVFKVNDARRGFACVNDDQRKSKCVDYRVRFTCPEKFCSQCSTQWFDRDDPRDGGDYELLSDLLNEYPGLICADPIGIEVQTVSGQPASQTGNIFRVNDATRGFACVNDDQRKRKCVDYRVRFTCPEKFCSQCTTQWFDLDDPSDDGDYELLSKLLDKYPESICPDPIGIEAQTLSGQPAFQTGNIFQVNDATHGFACVNDDQRKRKCVDYRVRFTCPEKFCSQCTTKWFDLDDPSGEGDYELLSKLLDKYPESICPDPIGIEAQTLSGQPAFQTGNIFQVYDPLKGFACVNKQQKDRPCEDYMVRFTCPWEFCEKWGLSPR